MRKPLGIVLLVAGLLAPAAPASAQDRTCSGGLGAETVANVTVPPNATCDLDGTTVTGNVVVGRGATLRATGGSVGGNVQAEGAARIVVGSSRIGGSFQIKQGGGADIRSTPVEGDIQLDANGGAVQNVVGNTVGGNVQVNANRGGVDIVGNVIDGDLQCQSNSPAPTGGSNTVREAREGQCDTLRPADPAPGPTPGPAPAPGAGAVPQLGTGTFNTSRRGSRVRVPLRCPAGTERCAGSVTMNVRADRSAGTAELGGARFRIAAGKRGTVALRLTREGRSLARSTRRLKVTITIRAAGRTVSAPAVVR